VAIKKKEIQMHKLTVLVGLLLLTAGSALAQTEYPAAEVSTEFLYTRTPVGGQSLNCAGGAGTLGYNVSSTFAIVADLGYCKFFGNTFGLGGKISGSEFNYLLGPKLTFRNSRAFHPFFDLLFGGMRLGLACDSIGPQCVNATGHADFSRNAFAMTVGGGLDLKLGSRVTFRAVQLDYLYTRFLNDCPFEVCNNNNNNQNGFRLKSGLVFGLGHIR
jgi:opacity protein-like surface antigen